MAPAKVATVPQNSALIGKLGVGDSVVGVVVPGTGRKKKKDKYYDGVDLNGDMITKVLMETRTVVGRILVVTSDEMVAKNPTKKFQVDNGSIREIVETILA